MARFKRVSDEQIVTVAMRCVITTGPSLTLAEVGAQVGLSAATIVQRFGSKRALMERVVEMRGRRIAAVTFEGDGPPVDRVIAGLAELTEWMETPEHVANATAVLHTEVANPELREIIDAGYRDQRATIAGVLDEAIANGQLRQCDTAAIARLMQLTVLGAQQSWAIESQGDLADWVAQCLRTCIAPWVVNADEVSATA